MIYSVRSNNKSFKSVEFHTGLNVVLADRQRNVEQENKNTRNGAGKTTLVEIIHFCLGSNVDSNSIFRSKELEGWSFILKMDIGNSIYTIERFIDNPSKIYIDGDLHELHFTLHHDKELDRYYVSKKNFLKEMQGELYGIFSFTNNATEYPKFRALISYAIRKGIGAYANPFLYYPRQSGENKQLCNAFLLNLNVDYAVQLIGIKDKAKRLAVIQRSIIEASQVLKPLKESEIKDLLTHLSSEAEKLKQQLDSFVIDEEYENITNKANELTSKIQVLTNKIILGENLLGKYEKSINSGKDDVPLDSIKKVYTEAGVYFNELLQKRLDQVIDFHSSLINNRRDYLLLEIKNLKENITSLKSERDSFCEQRGRLMETLHSKGALNECSILQEQYVKYLCDIEHYKNLLHKEEQFKEDVSSISSSNDEIVARAQQDYTERQEIRNKAIDLFAENTKYLYAQPGELKIELGKDGYKFNIKMQNSRSQGINYMKVLCYDLVIAEIGKTKERFPDFIIHDSTIFDGVDERQQALALQLVYKKCKKNGLQYICLMNSDSVPYGEFDHEFRETFDKSVVLRISDESETSGILGIRV